MVCTVLWSSEAHCLTLLHGQRLGDIECTSYSLLTLFGCELRTGLCGAVIPSSRLAAGIGAMPVTGRVPVQQQITLGQFVIMTCQ